MPVVKLKPSPDSKTHSSDTPQTIKQEVSTKSPDSQNPGDSKFLAEVKKTSGVKFKSSSYSKTHKSDNRKTTKPEVSSSSEKVEVSSKKGSSKAKDLNLSAKHATSLKPKSMTVKSMSSPNSSGGISGLRKSDIKIGKMTGASKVTVKKALASPRGSLSLDSSVNRVASSNERKHRNLKVASPLMNQNKIRKAEPKQPNNDEVQEKTLKVVSPLMNQNKIRKAEPKQPNNDEVQEKTLYIIKMETEKKPLESAQNKISAIELSHALSSSPDSSSLPNILSSSTHEEEYQEESEYTMSEADDDSPSENNEIENIEEADTLEEGYKGRPRKSGWFVLKTKVPNL